MTRIFYTDISALSNELLFSAYMEKVSPERRRKIHSLKNQRDKLQSLAAYICYLEALRTFGRVCAPDWEYSPKGKPYFKEESGLHFSLSHSENIAIAAVSEHNIGIDVERISDFREGVCRRFFSPSEADYVLDEAEPEARKGRFFRIWTLKEAYAKLTGRGTGDFANFEIIPTNPPDVHSFGEYTAVDFYEPKIPGFSAAVCIEGDDDDIEIEKINLFKLLIK